MKRLRVEIIGADRIRRTYTAKPGEKEFKPRGGTGSYIIQAERIFLDRKGRPTICFTQKDAQPWDPFGGGAAITPQEADEIGRNNYIMQVRGLMKSAMGSLMAWLPIIIMGLGIVILAALSFQQGGNIDALAGQVASLKAEMVQHGNQTAAQPTYNPPVTG